MSTATERALVRLHLEGVDGMRRKLAQKEHALEELNDVERGPAPKRWSLDEANRAESRIKRDQERAKLLGWVEALEWAMKHAEGEQR